MNGLAKAAVTIGAWEAFWWFRRQQARNSLYAEAAATAKAFNRLLVVVGAPDRGVTGGYPCGDVTLDIGSSTCPHHLQVDITKGLPFADDSVVVFVSCVLEYVDELDAAMLELRRVSGGRLWIARVEPWTLTAYLYPGAKQTIPADWQRPV